MKQLKEASIIPAVLLFAAMIGGPVFAQEDPGHQRINEVQGRIDNQENRVDQGINKGQLTPRSSGSRHAP